MEKEDLKYLVALLMLVAVFVLCVFLSPKDQPALKPHIFYNGAVYSVYDPRREYPLDMIRDSVEADGTIDTLLDQQEICDSDDQTNSSYFLDAVIYRLKDGSSNIMYVQTTESKDMLLQLEKGP